MEVKKGYKQTEVGVIPVDWQAKCLQQLGNPVRGGSPRPAGDPKYFDGNYIPWLTVAGLTNIPESRLMVTETQSCLTEEGSLRSRTLDVGTLIIANSGATLGVAKILGVRCCANDGIAALLNLTSSVSPRYVAHFVNTKTRYLREVVATGNGQPNLNTELIGNFRLPLPPTLVEQEAIATALSDADAWIESLEQLIAKKRQIKQGAMQELLTGKQRLPGFSEPWVDKAVNELLKSCRLGGNYPNSETETNHPLIKMGNIDRGEFNTNKVEYVSHNIVLNEQDRLRRGDLLFNTRNTLDLVGKVAVWREELPRAYFNSNLLRLDFDSLLVGTQFFMNLVMNSASVLRQLRELATGTTSVAAIYTRDLLRLRIWLPSDNKEQIAIATILTDLDSELTELKTKLTKARQIKQGMMQELLTGKIRLI